MKLLNFSNFELPRIFANWFDGQPPVKNPDRENRNVADMLAHPNFGLHDPNSLHFPDHNKPTVPTAGGYMPIGLGMVVYDHQPKWDRCADGAGPVRQFFRNVTNDNRVKHI